jgi:RluA family pseudouridine synthase
MNHNQKLNRTRLHKFVKDWLNEQGNHDYTNPEIQRNIEQYGVVIGGTRYFNRLHWVFAGQQLELDWPSRDHGPIKDIKVLLEHIDYLVLYKPAGVVVQAGAGHQKDNLVEWLLEHYPEQRLFDTTKFPSRGLVHRLDKLTQGVILVARNDTALLHFQNQFRDRLVHKKYLALVEGVLIDNIHIKNYQCRSKSNPIANKLFWSESHALSYDPKSRFAESVFKPLFFSRELDQTLVEVNIKTGRMHQIRLQAQAINHAVVHDPKYPKTTFSIPKSVTQYEPEFELGIYRQQEEDIHQLNLQEFTELRHSIFGDTQFCLLSNYLELQDPLGKTLKIIYKK